MHRVLLSFRTSLKISLRSKSVLFWNFLFPLVILLLFGVVFSERGDSLSTLYVQDLDQTELSNQVVANLKANSSIKLIAIRPGEDLEALIKKESIPRIVVIPGGFQSQSNNGLGALPVTYRTDESPTSNAMMGSVYGAVQALNFQLLGAVPRIRVNTDMIGASQVKYISFYLPGALGLGIMFSGLFSTAVSIVAHKKMNLFKKFLTTPFKRWEWVLSQTLTVLFMFMLSGTAMLILARFALKTQFRLPLIILPMIVLGVLLFSSLGAVLARFSGRDFEAVTTMANAIGFPMMILSGSYFATEMMPRSLQLVSLILPLTYINRGLRAFMIYDNYRSGLLNLLIVGLIAVVLLALSSKLFKWREA